MKRSPTAFCDPSASGRMLAIVGRPNVGKSAIFNRLIGERLAIVHSQPGVTRDRLVRELLWEGERLALADTGGLSRLDGEIVQDHLDAGISAQAEAALAEASAAILVVDITAGVTPQDLELARLMRKKGIPTVVAANKADEARHDLGAVEFERLGYPVFPVSALHGRGFADLMETVLPLLPPQAAAAEETPSATAPLRVAVVGRPNAGKSSYINRLLNRPRVLVSDVPGTTRDSIDVPFTVGEGAEARHYVLIDTAGARRETKIDTAVERYSRFRTQDSIERAEVVILMIDATRGVGRLDKHLAGEILEFRKGCLIVVNKWDLVQAQETPSSYGERLARELPFLAYCPVAYVSAATGHNVRQSVALLDHVAAQTQLTLSTGLLNRVLARASAAVAPPAGRGRPLRLYYATQVSRNPLIVRLFVNDPKRMPANYRDYLVNQLRRQFGLEGAPVLLQLRMRTRATRKPVADEAPSERGRTAKRSAPRERRQDRHPKRSVTRRG